MTDDSASANAPATDVPGHARDGLAHLQAAAKEMIAASRALLDAAEELVEDPAVLSDLMGTLGALAKLAGKAAAGAAPGGGRGSSPDDDGGEPRVQRIRVS
jgi:hypothetical protein